MYSILHSIKKLHKKVDSYLRKYNDHKNIGTIYYSINFETFNLSEMRAHLQLYILTFN